MKNSNLNRTEKQVLDIIGGKGKFSLLQNKQTLELHNRAKRAVESLKDKGLIQENEQTGLLERTEKDAEQTKVIFRKYKSGEIIALFPALPGDNSALTCSSYMHTGQHSSADIYDVITETEPAKPEEFEMLEQELEAIGYNLRVVLKQSPADYTARRNEITKVLE